MAKKEKEEVKKQAPEETPQEPVEETPKEKTPEEPKQKEISPWEEKYNSEHDARLRLAAEYDNFRKRTTKEKEQSYGNGKADAVTKMLPIYDNLERALNQPTEDAAYKKGVELTMTELLKILNGLGVEVFGAPKASADAEVISLAISILNELGIKSVKAKINSIGCPECRPKYNAALKEYLKANYDELCETCKTRYEKNPLRILDCKEKRCGEIAAAAPKVLDYLCPECQAHFEELKASLDALGIEYEVDPMIVRGLDYYTKTVFELVSTEGAYTGTVCGGGRYDGLIEQLGGPKMNAVGFGMGMERLLLVAESFNPIPEPNLVDIYIAPVGDEARNVGLKLAGELRKHGVKTEFDHVGRSFKAQFKYADKLNARFVAVIGEDEVKNGVIKLKNMADGTETALGIEGFAEKAAELVK